MTVSRPRLSSPTLWRLSSKIIGVQQSSLTDPYSRQVLRKCKIHPVSHCSPPSQFQSLPSGSWFRFSSVRVNIQRHSWVAMAMFLLHSGQGVVDSCDGVSCWRSRDVDDGDNFVLCGLWQCCMLRLTLAVLLGSVYDNTVYVIASVFLSLALFIWSTSALKRQINLKVEPHQQTAVINILLRKTV